MWRFFLPLLPPVSDVQPDGNAERGQKEPEHQGIQKRSRHREPRELLHQKLNVAWRHVVVAQPHAHLPVPFRAGAESKAVPDSQPEPGKGGQAEREQVVGPRFPPDPAQKVEKDQAGMKEEKAHVQHLVQQPGHGIVLYLAL